MSPTEDSIERWRCGGLIVEDASKQLRLFERAMVHVSGPGCQRLCSPQVRMLVERLWKRLGALEDTGQSTASVGVGTSWRGLYIHVQMPVSRSQVPFFQEKVWKRRGALEFTGRSTTASVGVCTSWRGLYIHVQMPVSRSQVPLFLEKVWKRRGALEFTGRSTASVGDCTSWRGTYTC